MLVQAADSDTANVSNKLEMDSSSLNVDGRRTPPVHRHNLAYSSVDIDSTHPFDSSGKYLNTIKEQKLTVWVQTSFVEFQKGGISGHDIDVQELIFDIVKLALDGNGNKVLPSLELVDFLENIVGSSKYNTVTTLDFILAFISKDSFDTNIVHDIKRLKSFSEYLSYLIKYDTGDIGSNKVFNSSKEVLSSIKTRIHSSIWGMEELIKEDKIEDYEGQNLIGKTIYSSQPLIGEIVNEINSNQPRAVLSYKLIKHTLIEILGTNINKVYSKLKRIYGKIKYSDSNKKNKVFSPNLLYSIYLSVVMTNYLYQQGLSSNTLSPGIIFLVLLRDGIEHFPTNWEEKLMDHNISYGVNELNIKIKDGKFTNPETIIEDIENENICNASVIRSNIQNVFKKYGIEYFKFMNEALKRYKTFFSPPTDKTLNREMWLYGHSTNEDDQTLQSNNKWFFGINDIVIEDGVTKAIDFIDEYHFLENSLSRNGLSSAIIVGESKLTKRTLVEYLAQRIINGNSSVDLRGYRVIGIHLDSLLESCINPKKTLTEQIKMRFDDLLGTYNGKVIIFTDDLFSTFETPTGPKRLFDILKHYIIRGKLKVIAALAENNYKALVDKDAEVKSFFDKIKMKDLSGIVSEIFISGLRYQFELSTGIFINNDAIRASVRMCSKYIENCVLPDGAIELINSSLTMAKNEQFLELPSAIRGIEDSISHSRSGIKVSKIRDYELNSTIESNRSRLLEALRMQLKLRNMMISLALKIKPYLNKFRYLKTQLYFMMLIYINYPIVCNATPEEDELKILEDREKIIPNFSDELTAAQLTSIYRKNILNYKQANNKSYDESINDVVSAVTESQLNPKFFDDIHPIIKEKQKEVASMKYLILEMAFNYNSLYSPLGMGEIDASHIAFIISERYGVGISKLLDEVEYRKLPEKMKNRLSEILSKYIIGQEAAIDYVSYHLGVELLRDSKNYPRCLLLVGPAGSGKKTFALALQTTLIESTILYNDFSYDITMYSHLKTINSKDFADVDAPKRLLGDDTAIGIIPEALKQSASTVFLFEDIENAHRDVIRLILDILQNKDNISQKTGFLGKCTFIFTTKVGSDIIINNPDKIETIKIRVNVNKILREKLSSGLVRVVQNLVLFRPFTKEEAVKILGNNFSEYSTLIKKNYNITFLQPSLLVFNQIVDAKYSPELGYKPILDYFEKNVKEKVMQFIHKGILKSNMTFKIMIRNNVSNSDSSDIKVGIIVTKPT